MRIASASAWASILVIGVAASRTCRRIFRHKNNFVSALRARHRRNGLVTYSASVGNKIKVEDFGLHGRGREHVQIELLPAYGRKQHPETEVEKHIDDMWSERMAANPRLFNGTKFRYGSSEVLTPSSSSASSSSSTSSSSSKKKKIIPPLKLKLWFTDYRTYLGADLGRYIDSLVSR
eukprot:jgi/Bigna1/138493/aug1.45_g13201